MSKTWPGKRRSKKARAEHAPSRSWRADLRAEALGQAAMQFWGVWAGVSWWLNYTGNPVAEEDSRGTTRPCLAIRCVHLPLDPAPHLPITQPGSVLCSLLCLCHTYMWVAVCSGLRVTAARPQLTHWLSSSLWETAL